MRALLPILLLATAPAAFAQFLDESNLSNENKESVVIQNANVVTADGKLEGKFDIFIGYDGSIEIGEDGAFESGAAPEINVVGDDLWVTPGLFAPFSHVGLVDIGAEAATNDTRAGDARSSVSNRASDAFNPKAVSVGNSRVEGLTHLATVPGGSGNIFAGTGAIVNTSGNFDSLVVEDAFIYVRLGEGGANTAGGSRSAAMTQLRDAFDDALEVSPTIDNDFGNVLTRRDALALRQALSGRLPLVVNTNRAMDLMRLIELKDEYSNLDIIVLGATEAWQVADELATADIKVMIDPHRNLPESFESVGARLDNANILDAAGVEYAFTTASADLTHNVRVLAQHAGNAVGEGLDWNKAFAAISTTPREWFGVNDDSLVVWVGDPLEVTSQPLAMFIDGEEISLTSRQTALRDRYNPATDDIRPHKYR